jgi:hypothetical protein
MQVIKKMKLQEMLFSDGIDLTYFSKNLQQSSLKVNNIFGT